MKNEFSARFKSYREYFSLSEAELAEKTGVGYDTVISWENGDSSPDTEQLVRLAEIYNVTLDTFVHIEPEDALFIGDDDDEKTNNFADKPSEAFSKTETDIHITVPKAIYDDSKIVSAKNGKTFVVRDRKKRIVSDIPFVLIALAVFFILGFTRDLWHPAWLVFPCIPVADSVLCAIRRKSVRRFNYPLFVAVVYLFLGAVVPGIWHPTWLVFLTVPLFYWIF